MNECVKTWEYETFEIINICQCTGIAGTWLIDGELRSCPVSFLAVANVTTHYRGTLEDGITYMREEDYTRNEVVALDLSGGGFEVCNEANNFGGFCHEGSDIKHCTGLLSGDQLDSANAYIDAIEAYEMALKSGDRVENSWRDYRKPTQQEQKAHEEWVLNQFPNIDNQ